MKIQSLSLLFVAAFVLTACGGAPADTSVPGSTTSSAPTTLPSDPLPSSSSNRSSSSVASSSSSAASSQAVSSEVASSSSSILISSSTSSSTASISAHSSSMVATLSTSSSSSSSSLKSSSSSLASSSSSSSSSNTSSTQSVSSSSAASSICSKVDGNIFIDCTDLAWNGLQAYEQTKDYKTQGPVTDGTQGQMATWQTVVSADQSHNNVVEVQFKDNDIYNANVHFFANALGDTRDMSAYATGKLMFDIKLLNAGKFSPVLNVMMECIYPCVSHGHPIAIPTLNQWTSVEVPIAEFIEGGLKITETGISFEIVPDWNKQNGVLFQLDNIRWVKGTGVAPTPETHCYEQRFETWGLPFHFDTLVGATSLTTGALTQIISTSLMTPNWSSTTDKLGYAPRTDSSFTPCAFTDGRISAQIYAPKSYVDDGKMRVGLYYEDSSARRAYFPSVSAASLTADAWKTISVPLITAGNAPAFSAVDAAFDINSINYAGVYFDANGKPANVGGMLRVDNIFISGTPVTPSAPSSTSILCNAGTQSFSGATPVGIGFPASNHFYVRAALTNAKFTGLDPSLSSTNTQSLLAHGGNNSASTVFNLTAINWVAATEQLQAAFSYQATDPNTATSVTFAVYLTPSDAVNATNNPLSTDTVALVGGVTCGLSSLPSSSAASSSSSSSSSVNSSSSHSTSSSSSSSNASCSVGAKVDTSLLPLGFDLASGDHGYLVIKLNNAHYVTPAPQVSITNALVMLGSSYNSKLVYNVAALDNLPASSNVSINFGFQQLNANSSVSRTISLYDTAAAAEYEISSQLLSTSTAQIASAASCN